MSPFRRLRRTPTLLLALAVAMLIGACQVRTDVQLTVDRDGSGEVAVTVTLDRRAAAQIPDLAAQLRVDDLRRAGWRLAGPVRTPSGGLRVAVRKRFGRPEQARSVLGELAGKGGPFSRFTVERTHSFARTKWSVDGKADLSRGLSAFSDQRVTALVGGQPFGRSEDEMRLLAGGSLADAAPFRLRIRLPSGDDRTYVVRLGDRPLPVDAVSTETDTGAYVLGGAAALAGIGAVVLFLFGSRIRRRPPRAERGMGVYDRKRYEAIVDTEDGPAPGSGGAPELVRLRRSPSAQRPPDSSSPHGPGSTGSRPGQPRPGGPSQPRPRRPSDPL